MYENSDSDRTITPHPVDFLWTSETIEEMITDTNEITEDMVQRLDSRRLNTDNDWSVLLWGPDLDTYNRTLCDHQVKVSRAIARFREMLENKEATIGDVTLKNRLSRAWTRLAEDFTSRINLFERIKLRALERPTKRDLAVIRILPASRQSLSPSDFDNTEHMAFGTEITRILLPRYLRPGR